MVITEEIYDSNFIIYIKDKITTRKSLSFKRNRQENWKRLGSGKQETTSLKVSSEDEVMNKRGAK